jgi:hypothetical protein
LAAPSNLSVVKPIQQCNQKSSRLHALIRYDALNQSEPLRIILHGVLALTCLAASSLSEAVGYDEMGTPATVASILAAVASTGLLVRECTCRTNQLTRIEKELNTELLPTRLSTNALADMPFTKAVTLKEDLKGNSPIHLVLTPFWNQRENISSSQGTNYPWANWQLSTTNPTDLDG